MFVTCCVYLCYLIHCFVFVVFLVAVVSLLSGDSVVGVFLRQACPTSRYELELGVAAFSVTAATGRSGGP